MGWQIVKHSFLMLWRNLANALRVSVGPVVLAVIVAGLIMAFSGGTPEILAFGMVTGELPTTVALALILVLIVMVFAFAWIAVSWHRFILLEEYPGLLPAVGNRPIWAYAGLSMLLGLVMLTVLMPAVFVAGIIGSIGGNSAVLTALLGIAIGVYFTYFWLRTALILPAKSVGQPLGIAAVWRLTGTLSIPILQAATILVLINVAGSGMIGIIAGGMIGVLIEILFSWITLMIGTSILTTLYGVLIEKRDLPA